MQECIKVENAELINVRISQSHPKKISYISKLISIEHHTLKK